MNGSFQLGVVMAVKSLCLLVLLVAPRGPQNGLPHVHWTFLSGQVPLGLLPAPPGTQFPGLSWSICLLLLAVDGM